MTATADGDRLIQEVLSELVTTALKLPKSAEVKFPSFGVFWVRAGSVAEGLLFWSPSFFGDDGGMIGAFVRPCSGMMSACPRKR